MSKVIHISAVAILGTLLVASIIAPNSGFLWQASSDFGFNLIRAGLILVLLWILDTHPPRNIILRISSGILAMAASGWVLFLLYEYRIVIMDALSVLLTCVVVGITVLEYQPDQPQTSKKVRIPVHQN